MNRVLFQLDQEEHSQPAQRGAARGCSRSQTRASAFILALLVLVTLALLYKQSRFDAHFFNPPPMSEKAPEAPANATGGKAAVTARTAPAPPDGFDLMGNEEPFDEETLSDKIDGKADLYLSSGFRGLRCQRYASKAAPEDWFEIYVYDMGEAQNAFSVYSAQRRPDVKPSDVAASAYATENSLFLSHDKYYVEIVGANAAPALGDAIAATARAFVQAHGGGGAGFDTGTLLPPDGLVPGSTKLLLKDVFGYDRLDNVTLADYVVDGTTITAFATARKDAAEARELFDGYLKMLGSVGAETVAVPGIEATSGTAVLDVIGDTEVVFLEGKTMAGVHAARKRAPALAFAEKLRQHVRSGKP